MVKQIAMSLLVGPTLLVVAMLAAATEQDGKPFDPFALDGSRNIMQECHFGIVNGKLTVGIPYKNVLSIDGLWAPPYLSTNFDLKIALAGQPVATQRYTWHPCFVERAGAVQGVDVQSITMLIPGSRAGLVEIAMKNTAAEQREVPVALSVGGTLDRSEIWGFVPPVSHTVTKPKIVDGSLRLEQGGMAIVLRGSKGIRWEDGQPRGRATVFLPPSGQAKLYVAFAIGAAAAAQAECEKIGTDLQRTMADAQTAYAARVQSLLQTLPRLKSSNPALDCFYARSLMHFLMNRWDVPEFILHPFYGTGSVRGGCLRAYLWNFGDCWEIVPLYDAAASRAHIKQFLANDMMKHNSIEPITGKAEGPWYMVNQEKIIGMIYYHVQNTGDKEFLNDKVNGKTVLEHAVTNAMYRDDLAKPVRMIDYGSANDHLELRRGLPYNHVMPDLNGRRYQNYVLAAELADLAGDGKTAAQLRGRAEELKTVLKNTLWNKNTRWFDFQDDKGKRDTRYTVQILKLFGSKVLDNEEESGLLGHLLNEKEFLSDYGLHSLAKGDPAYDPEDVDNGGPGICTGFVGQIAEKLYKAGKPDAAENILRRVLWWGDRLPYWGDSIVADKIEYRHDTPLQCTIDGVALAQCVIFGMFGVQADFNGEIRINPHPPTFAPKMELRGLKLRGHVLDIIVQDDHYEVRMGDRSICAAIGQPVLMQGGQLRNSDTTSAFSHGPLNDRQAVEADDSMHFQAIRGKERQAR
jgi:hypothetical protein